MNDFFLITTKRIHPFSLTTKDRKDRELSRLSVFLLVMVAGCATPVSHTNAPLSTYDKDTEYAITDSPRGYSITVYYSRYQFFPESDALAAACKSQLMAIAWEYSDKAGREIKPINEQRIRLSMGRNGLSGITSCQAHGVAEWAGTGRP